MLQAKVQAIAQYLPDDVVTNQTLSAVVPTWTAEQLGAKTGIVERRIAAPAVCSSDLAVAAAQKLFEQGTANRADIDLLMLCTQTPDYFLPTTACMLQDRLGLPRSCAAFDVNLGCSGYVYGLGLVKAMLQAEQAKSALLIMAETYSKFMRPDDISVRAIFGDAATATLLTAEECNTVPLAGSPYAFVYGTDGTGAKNLMVRYGGMREPSGLGSDERPWLYMNGPEIFTFTLRVVPQLVNDILRRAELDMDDIDMFLFHQANGFMLEHLRRKMGVPVDKFVVQLSHCGNTVSSTIPIALQAAVRSGSLRPGMKVMLVGFGVGYSWGGCLLEWPEKLALL